ncbi:MAG: TonB family protein [Bacteroidia bacterium]
MYKVPSSISLVFVPAIMTVLLHALVVYLMTVSWAPDESKVVRVKPAPKAISARLVDASEFRPTPKPKKAKPIRKATPKPVVQPKPKPVVPKIEAKPEPKPEPELKPEPKQEPRITPEELRAIAQQELANTLDAEAAAEATATADEMAASFAGLIQGTVVNYWSRPPSARNGMETLLSIQLIPTGEVVSVQILQSSGNASFDRSAVNAVNKAGAFPELQKLPIAEFEKTFRRLRLLFRPEDLRY